MTDPSDVHARPREPVFNVPWPALAIAAVILIAYGIQLTLGAGDADLERWGFSPADLGRGRFVTLLTSQFLHAGWAHAGMNAIGALAFAAPVSRRLGVSPGGAAAFFAFYLVCGIIACLGYAALNLGGEGVVIGASGAVSGLMGAASRMAFRPPDMGIAPLRDRQVLGMAAAWIIANALLAATGMTPGSGGAPIAWQAHLAGYAAGLLLIGPLLRIKP